MPMTKTPEERKAYWRQRRAKAALITLGFVAGVTANGVVARIGGASASPAVELEFIHLSRFDSALPDGGGTERRTAIRVHQCVWDAGTALLCGDVLTDVHADVLSNVHSFIEAMTDAGTRRLWQERYLP